MFSSPLKALGAAALLALTGCKKNEPAPTDAVQNDASSLNLGSSSFSPHLRSHLYGGLPRSEQKLTILTNIGYIVGYNEEHGHPAYVAFRLDKFQELGEDFKPVPKRSKSFERDERTEADIPRSIFTGSGYVMGHLVPYEAIARIYTNDTRASDETFLLSNAAAQYPGFNGGGGWRKIERLELVYANAFNTIWVICGTICDDQKSFVKKDDKRVDVPDKFFRIEVDETHNGPRTLSMSIPHQKRSTTNLVKFLVSIDNIEDETKIDYFPDLNDEAWKRVEALVPTEIWQVTEELR